jgi:hypothetical protein
MYPRAAQYSALRIAIALIICTALLPLPGVSLSVSGLTQGQSDPPGRRAVHELVHNGPNDSTRMGRVYLDREMDQAQRGI